MADTVGLAAAAAPVVVAPLPTPVVSTVDHVLPAGTVARMSPTTRDRLSAIGTVALLLLGAGTWLFGEAKVGPDDSMHKLAPAMLVIAAVLAGGSWLLRTQERMPQAASGVSAP